MDMGVDMGMDMVSPKTCVVQLYCSSRAHCGLPGLCVSLCVCVMDFLRWLYMLVHVYVYTLTVLEARSPR